MRDKQSKRCDGKKHTQTKNLNKSTEILHFLIFPPLFQCIYCFGFKYFSFFRSLRLYVSHLGHLYKKRPEEFWAWTYFHFFLHKRAGIVS